MAPLDAGTVAVFPRLAEDTEKKEPLGYLIEMRLPVHAPLELRPGYRFRLDASVILADSEGKRSAVRIPWHSRDPQDMTVNDTYLESLLRPSNWGEAVLEH